MFGRRGGGATYWLSGRTEGCRKDWRGGGRLKISISCKDLFVVAVLCRLGVTLEQKLSTATRERKDRNQGRRAEYFTGHDGVLGVQKASKYGTEHYYYFPISVNREECQDGGRLGDGGQAGRGMSECEELVVVTRN